MVDPNFDQNPTEVKDAATEAAPWTKSTNHLPVAEGVTYHDIENSSASTCPMTKQKKRGGLA
ncbi:hypothetical protein CCR94_21860 [Rhodoblastus sphagnicola]|uniref:Uncharacterized protein n=1 Tax=Rhodoblastus sphagnicola TaxID=333368 RepID=A0A2S6MWC7_9HYPH|nr:hypothetical protein [Rhodoblastus sphagnicola]MBB4200182.1 hypothetical protein [Rhodoblastus sphagnicola]PPQ26666.1 hypothetical protein CCR94_21860 [Rhodoblastus sphagnicola]